MLYSCVHPGCVQMVVATRGIVAIQCVVTDGGSPLSMLSSTLNVHCITPGRGEVPRRLLHLSGNGGQDHTHATPSQWASESPM